MSSSGGPPGRTRCVGSRHRTIVVRTNGVNRGVLAQTRPIGIPIWTGPVVVRSGGDPSTTVSDPTREAHVVDDYPESALVVSAARSRPSTAPCSARWPPRPAGRAGQPDALGAHPHRALRAEPSHRPQGHRLAGQRRRARAGPGQGHLRRPRRVRSNLHMASFSDDMRRRGLEPSSTLVGVSREPTADAVADFFGGAAGWRVERMRLANGEPMALEVDWINADARARPRHPRPEWFALRDPRRGLREPDRHRRADRLGR